MDTTLKNRALHRILIINGQLDGLAKAIESETYCTALLGQSLSIQNSMKSLDRLMLENHLTSHVRHQMRQAGKSDKAIRELLDIYTLSTK